MLDEVLASRRRRRFVGRQAETERFRQGLAAQQPSFAVLYVHGPGGVGKTSLLQLWEQDAADAGARVVRVDGRQVQPSRVAMLEAVDGGGDRWSADTAATDGAGTGHGRLVVLIDGYEHLVALDEWVRTELLPRVPPSTVIVIADRHPPGPAWRADPAWQDLLTVVPLRNLSRAEVEEYLGRSGVDPALHQRIVRLTYGHPLGLSLLADAVRRGGEQTLQPLPRDVVGALVHRFVEGVPSGWQRRALAVCALARVTTEPLLRTVLDEEPAREAFAWLDELPCVEAVPDGLSPHELARDALAADLRWRDPQLHEEVFRRVRIYLQQHVQAALGRERYRALSDVKYLFRSVPIQPSPVDWQEWGRHHPEPARPDDRSAIIDLAHAFEGAASAELACRWLERQPEAFAVVRREDGGVRGFLALVDLTAASPDDRAADPGVQAAWEHAHRSAPPRSGETVTQLRFVIDAESYQDPSPTLNAAPLLTNERLLSTSGQAWDFLTLHEPERWDAYFAVADYPRAQGADFVVDDRRYGLYGHDFRQVPIEALLERWTERALRQDAALVVDPGPEVMVLAHDEFCEAVRQALRDLHRPDLLARNALLHARLLRQRTGGNGPGGDILEQLLREAIDQLARHPRDDKLLRAVDATYLRPAATQEAAARALGLPFSTYRRHLTRGVSRVCSWLWEQELGGIDHTAVHPG